MTPFSGGKRALGRMAPVEVHLLSQNSAFGAMKKLEKAPHSLKSTVGSRFCGGIHSSKGLYPCKISEMPRLEVARAWVCQLVQHLGHGLHFKARHCSSSPAVAFAASFAPASAHTSRARQATLDPFYVRKAESWRHLIHPDKKRGGDAMKRTGGAKLTH